MKQKGNFLEFSLSRNSMSEKLYTKEEVLTHNKEGDCWIIIEDQVFDVSKFLNLHPAGKNVIL